MDSLLTGLEVSMKRLWFVLFSLFLSACAPKVAPTVKPTAAMPAASTSPSVPTLAAQPSNLPDLGPAPELENTVWLNTDHPLRLKDLRGNVVLLDMWTFG
jgi:hypothetical protein